MLIDIVPIAFNLQEENTMFRRMLVFTLLLFLIVLVASSLVAQDDAIATGLNNPRHLFIGSDGTLYIAEAGTGGDQDAEGPYGAVKLGTSGQFSVVNADGQQSVIVPELLSMDAGFGQIEGPTSLYVTDDSYWLVLGMGPKEVPTDKYAEAVVQVDRETLSVDQVIDLGAYERENNPDGAPEIVANPIDIDVADDGTVYIADASANTLFSWTEEAGLLPFAIWQPEEGVPQPVPTAIEIGPDGSLYVSFLSGFPFPPGGARVEQWSPEGELLQTYEGLTLVTDVLVTEDGTVYAVELASGFGDAGYIPDSGRVISVTDMAVLADGLNFPYGLAQDAEGTLWVTVNSAFSEPDSGMVVPVTMGEMTPLGPASTPDVASTQETSG
jgi:hypothetical protein